MNCVLFLKCIKSSVKKQNTKKYWKNGKILDKSGKFVSPEKWEALLMPRFKPIAHCHHTV